MKSKTEKTIRRNRLIIKSLWWTFGIGSILLILLFIAIYNGMIGYMPPVEELKNPADKFASVVYTTDGEELGRYFRNTGKEVEIFKVIENTEGHTVI